MLTAYRQSLEHELAGSATAFEALPGVSRLMPWIERPDDLTVWAVALGAEPPPNGLNALFWAAARVGSILS